jgi:hypothetical protein
VNPLLQRISIDPRIGGGKPRIKGTRIWVSLILDFLAEGMTEASFWPNIRSSLMKMFWRRSPLAPRRRGPLHSGRGRVSSSWSSGENP